MRGSSRGAAAAGDQTLDAVLAGGIEATALSDDLFGVTGAVDSSATLRRALTDPSRDADAKQDLAGRLFDGKVSSEAVLVLKTLVGQRWATERDFSDTIEVLAVSARLAAAERGGRIDAVEDELFRFERIVAGDAGLRDALTDRNADPATKAELVGRLLEGKASPETIALARQSMTAPRGRKFTRTMEQYLELAARRREQVTAVVTAAIELDGQQRERLSSALQRIYGKPVLLQVMIDPKVLGGIRVQIGDEVVDGTILRKLDGARRHIAG